MNAVYIAAGALMTVSGVSFSFGRISRTVLGSGAFRQDPSGRVHVTPVMRNAGDIMVMCGVLFLLYGFFPFFRMHVVSAALIGWSAAAVNDITSLVVSRRRLTVRAVPVTGSSEGRCPGLPERRAALPQKRRSLPSGRK